MLNAGNSNRFLTLYQAAQDYLRLGFSVIPVYTDTVRAKVAAVGWSRYQQQRPTPDELYHWFIEQEHTGLAVVTGVVSGLAVLDFDDLVVFDFFQRQHPDLAATRRIQTRRGVHLWYAIPAESPVASRKGQRVDWKADGGYVVAPPTCIDGQTYAIDDEVTPRALTTADLATIRVFLDSSSPPQTGQTPAPQIQSHTTHDLIWHYQRAAGTGNRNEALFHASLRARDSGYPMQVTLDLLAEIHVRQPAVGFHSPERQHQRRKEAIATVCSAYSRPPRPPVEKGRAEVEQLPNTIRERLFQMGCTHTVRVIEALRLKGIQPTQALTYAQIVQMLAGLVGQWSIRAALAATTVEGTPLFEQNPPDPQKKHAHADNYQATSLNILANVSPEKPTRSPSHRPPTYYRLPSNNDLCRKLGVLASASDPLTPADLASAKQTRMAAHRELIKRRPGLYPRRWLARRLGVDAETLDTYNREIPIQVRHCFSEKLISWHNLEDIPLSLEIAGTFLEDENGKRYPVRRQIAQKLLARRHTVYYKRQDVNHYWYGESHQAATDTALQMPPANPPPPKTFSNWFIKDAPTIDSPRAVDSPDQSQAIRQTHLKPALPTISETGYRDRAAEERLAERVYRTVLRLSEDKAQRMSKANVHRLVETYGIAAVEQGLKKLKWYAGKSKVTNPAGFLITTSRLAWRELHGKTGLTAPAPRFRGVRNPQ